MGIIINPGSNIATAEKESKWSNTHDQAKRYAYEWFYKPMLKEGFTDISVEDTEQEIDGRWLFKFKHEVAGVVVELEVHGIDDLDAYQKEYIFTPKVYWNGGSSSNPELEQFAAEGYKPVMTYESIS